MLVLACLVYQWIDFCYEVPLKAREAYNLKFYSGKTSLRAKSDFGLTNTARSHSFVCEYLRENKIIFKTTYSLLRVLSLGGRCDSWNKKRKHRVTLFLQNTVLRKEFQSITLRIAIHLLIAQKYIADRIAIHWATILF